MKRKRKEERMRNEGKEEGREGKRKGRIGKGKEEGGECWDG